MKGMVNFSVVLHAATDCWSTSWQGRRCPTPARDRGAPVLLQSAWTAVAEGTPMQAGLVNRRVGHDLLVGSLEGDGQAAAEPRPNLLLWTAQPFHFSPKTVTSQHRLSAFPSSVSSFPCCCAARLWPSRPPTVIEIVHGFTPATMNRYHEGLRLESEFALQRTVGRGRMRPGLGCMCRIDAQRPGRSVHQPGSNPGGSCRCRRSIGQTNTPDASAELRWASVIIYDHWARHDLSMPR